MAMYELSSENSVPVTECDDCPTTEPANRFETVDDIVDRCEERPRLIAGRTVPVEVAA